MINPQMRTYNYYLYGEENEYGQPSLSADPVGKVKMAIHDKTDEVADNIIYDGTQYVGLTSSAINEKYVIDFNGKKLKVIKAYRVRRFTVCLMAVM